jgi:phospholipid transport system substrate-binding protein
MNHVLSTSTGGTLPWRRRTSLLAGFLAAALTVLWTLVPAKPAAAADPAVVFMAQVGRELMAAARTRSPGVMANVIQKYGDIRYIGDYSLGSYRSRLAEADREAYHNGMVRFVSRYAASAAPKVNVTRVEWSNFSTRGSNGINVDCTVTLGNGTSWDVRWVLRKIGDTYKVRDAEVLGVNVASYLRSAFEDYLSQNGGHPRALVTVLNR